MGEILAILRLLVLNLNCSQAQGRSLLHQMQYEFKQKVTTHSAMGRRSAEIVKSTFDGLRRISKHPAAGGGKNGNEINLV
ncbi:MAG TPA: hypothetical protein IGS52_02710 [Oscillatoriaceae cyanobacterium M33_DOE_052]|uniref:Uncharacterized protein n=1 Tax=Planktothricoides sp. SpSt-374 TaxID=2282167 RepID=A0A7C3ZI95_9CYAN|nr:hypothetical protein [Oscillatoriaceae cyanobacterium M33_DOE_052]